MVNLLCKLGFHDWRTIVLRTEGPPRICYRCKRDDWSRKALQWSKRIIADEVPGKLWPGHSYEDKRR